MSLNRIQQEKCKQQKCGKVLNPIEENQFDGNKTKRHQQQQYEYKQKRIMEPNTIQKKKKKQRRNIHYSDR